MFRSPSDTATVCGARWDARIARARRLASERTSSAELLNFYAALAEFQKPYATEEPGEARHEFGSASHERFVARSELWSVLQSLLAWLPRQAPPALATAALPQRDWISIVNAYLECSGHSRGTTNDPVDTFVVEAALQPFAERTAIEQLAYRQTGAGVVSPLGAHSSCPHCGGLPVVAVLRPEGQGAKRTLLCGLCLVERDYRRGLCASCGEQRVDSLPVYTADRFEHVRIDACDGCRMYLKTIDLSKDGLAEPIVDDIASIALDLWAQEHGYRRLRRSLLGI